MANLGESADIERIAHDIYFVWNIDKTKRDTYFKYNEEKEHNPKTKKQEPTGRVFEEWDYSVAGDRANRIFCRRDETATHRPDAINPLIQRSTRTLKDKCLYVEQIKARDGRTGGWGLFEWDGERGYIGENNVEMMKL